MTLFAPSTIFQPLPKGLYTIGRSQILIAPLDPNTLQPTSALSSIGDSILKIDHKVDMVEIDSMDDSLHGTVDSIPVKRSCDLEIKVRQFNATVSALMFQSQGGVTAPQPAASANVSATFAGVAPGYVYTLVDSQVPAQFVAFPTIHSVTDDTAGNPVAYVLGVHYLVDAATGRIEVLAIPAGAKTTMGATNMVVTYDIPAPVAGGAPSTYGFMNNPAGYYYVGCRTNNRTGMNRWYEWTRCRGSVEGGITVSSEGNDIMAITLKLKVLLDPTMPPDRNFGFIRDLLPMSALGA